MLKVLYKQTNLGTTVLCVTGDVIHSNKAWNLEQTDFWEKCADH